MCGIAGLIGVQAPYAKTHIPNMVARMAHRGPDGNGTWYSDSHNVAFGHARLAIVDTSDAGAQPMHIADKGLHLVVNGEIYNYPTLRKELEDAYAIECQSDCDSEIILHGYAHEGIAFFKKLNGMFAFALLDDASGQVHLVRDRMGIKPLYLCDQGGIIAFASEIKSLVAAYDVQSWRVNRRALQEYLAYQTPMEGRTLFEHISLLQPGHHMIIDARRGDVVSDTAFWQPELKERPIDFDDAVAQYQSVLQDSVQRHLLSDVPVSTYLSAGFDSTSIAAMASRLSGHGLDAYTGAFGQEGGWYDETQTAAEAVQHFAGKHHVTTIGSDDFATHLDDVIHALDEPRMGMGAFPQYMVARHVAKDFKVILTGHGGDELFSGYPIFKLAQPGGWRSMKKNEIPHLAYFSLSKMCQSFAPEYGRHMPVLWDCKAQKKLLRNYDKQPIWQGLETLQKSYEQTIDQIYHTYLQVYLPNLLVVEDKISMAHAIESRTPFLDNAMLDISLSLPQKTKLHGHALKALIKEGGRDLIPESYYHQPKRGFPTPLRQWARGPMAHMIDSRLCDPDTPLHRLMDDAVLAQWVDRYKTSWKQRVRPLDEIQTHALWQLLSLDSWMRVWQERYGVCLI